LRKKLSNSVFLTGFEILQNFTTRSFNLFFLKNKTPSNLSLLKNKTPSNFSQPDPTTPIMNPSPKQMFNASQNKTPTLANRAKSQSLLKSAIKNSANKASSNLNVSISEAPATSTFQRRKSFDLNASLLKPLNYKMYTGKMKPVDFNAKSLFLASLATANSNNETKVVEKSHRSTSVLKPLANMNDTVTKTAAAASPLKKRLSAHKMGSVRAEVASSGASAKTVVAEISKSEAIRKESEKSNILKKLNYEKLKAKKQIQTDKNRNLGEQNENVLLKLTHKNPQ
jgi:hypothetical protein